MTDNNGKALREAKAWAVVVALLLAGCDIPPPAAHLTAPQDYTCTVEQMDRVQRESLFCDKNTGFLGEYCYGTAIIRNCTKRVRVLAVGEDPNG